MQQNFLKAEYLSSLLVGKMATTNCSLGLIACLMACRYESVLSLGRSTCLGSDNYVQTVND